MSNSIKRSHSGAKTMDSRAIQHMNYEPVGDSSLWDRKERECMCQIVTGTGTWRHIMDGKACIHKCGSSCINHKITNIWRKTRAIFG